MELTRTLLVTAISLLAAALAVLFVALLVERGVRDWRFARTRRIRALYRPAVDAWYGTGGSASESARVLAIPRRHRAAVAALLVAPLEALSGEIVERCRELLEQLGMVDEWFRGLGDRRWWRRAEAAHYLGLARVLRASADLVALLDDEHEEVRASAVSALGRIRDPSTIPVLVSQLHAPRAQRVRVIGALRDFGPAAAAHLARYGGEQPREKAHVAGALAAIGSASVIGPLLEWSSDPDATVRAASLAAIGSIGVDDRAYSFALQALSDQSADVRAMAARALGRSGRADSADHLERCLDDEWLVAAHAARALKQLGPPAHRHLERRAAQAGQGGELARQMLWEITSYA